MTINGGDRLAVDTAIEHLKDALTHVAADSPSASHINGAMENLLNILKRYPISAGQDEA